MKLAVALCSFWLVLSACSTSGDRPRATNEQIKAVHDDRSKLRVAITKVEPSGRIYVVTWEASMAASLSASERQEITNVCWETKYYVRGQRVIVEPPPMGVSIHPSPPKISVVGDRLVIRCLESFEQSGLNASDVSVTPVVVTLSTGRSVLVGGSDLHILP